MKRMVVSVLCVVLLFSLLGCGSDDMEFDSTDRPYYMVGDSEKSLTPCLWLYPDDQTFYFGAGSFSYAEHGTYEIKDNQLIVTSQTTTFVFDIIDENTLVLVDNGDNAFFKPPKGAEFVYSGN